jgi:hypothetical protein
MSLGVIKPTLLTLSAAVGSASVTMARAYDRVYLQVPTMASSSALDVYVSADGSSYYQFRKEAPNTSTVQNHSFIVAASCLANGSVVPLPGGFKGYKLVATDSNPTAAGSFYIVCSD